MFAVVIRACKICLRACKICVVFVVELNVKVIDVKYGRGLTHYILESNISTKQLHVPTTAFPIYSLCPLPLPVPVCHSCRMRLQDQ